MIDPPNFYFTALKMLGVLVVLLAGLYVCLKFLQRRLHDGSVCKAASLIRVLKVRSVGLKKQIALIEVPGAVLVIGMTGDRMQLLDKIVDPDIRNQITSASGQ